MIGGPKACLDLRGPRKCQMIKSLKNIPKLMQFKNKCQMIGSKHALVKEFENTYIKGIPEQKHKWADKKLGKWDFYPSTNLSIHFTGDFTVKVFPLQGLYPQSYIQWHIQQKGQIQMTHNKNILQAYLKFIESNCTCTVNTRIGHQNGQAGQTI